MIKPKWLCIGTVLLTCATWLGYRPAAPEARGDDQPRLPDRRSTYYPVDLAEELRAQDEARQSGGVAALTDAQVVAAMNAGRDKLLAMMADRVTRGIPTNDIQQGEWMMATYTLLVLYRLTGEDRLHFTSPEMAPLIKGLVSIKTNHTYSLSMQANALDLLPNKPEFRTVLKEVREKLLKGAQGAGSYTYYSPSKDAKAFDNSNSQYGVLGMWAVDDAGEEVDNNYWSICDRHWRQSQTVEGGWCYKEPPGYAAPKNQGGGADHSLRPSMTMAGIASLFITQEHLDTALRLDPVPDPNIVKGLKWLTANFKDLRADMGLNLYTAYGIERVGLASGLKYLGTYNWYKEGAVSILGSGNAGVWDDHGPLVGTCYALLFLARGRSPVVFTKLAYDGPWDARPRDIANLNRWLVKKTERYTNWQIVDMKNSEPEDWLDGPILVITGHGDPKFNDEQVAKLRKFIRMGGMIFSTADGGDKVFTEAITKKYAPMIYDNAYEMRELPLDHYVYTMEYRLEPGKDPGLMGMSNGAREVWIHSPKDMGASWQLKKVATTENFEVPFNIFQYASGRASLRTKLDSLTVKDPPTSPAKTLTVGQLKYAGNYDPEPGAWERFVHLAARDHALTMKLETVTPEELDPVKTPVVHMTGTAGFAFSAPQAKGIKDYLEKGGFLIIDATGGSQLFDDAVIKGMAAVLPGYQPEEVDVLAHPVMTGGKKEKWAQIKTLEMRKFCGTVAMKGRKPGVWEYKINGKPVALVFEADVTSGLLGTNTWGIFGYTPEVSEALAWNSLEYATSNAGPPPTRPATRAATRPAVKAAVPAPKAK